MLFIRPLLILKSFFLILFNLLLFNLSHAQYAPEAFVTKWQVLSANPFPSPSIYLSTEGAYHYKLYQVVGITENLIQEASSEDTITLVLPDTGIYIVEIIPDTLHPNPFHRYFTETSLMLNTLNLIELKQWGHAEWSSFNEIFRSAYNLDITATDIPILEHVEDMSKAFFMASSITQIPNINNWDVSNVKNMEQLFYSVQMFNEELGNWDVSSVTNMHAMFSNTHIFNQDISGWDVSNVENMNALFSSNPVFNQDLSNWNTGKVTDMAQMFVNCHAFNQDIGQWNTSNVTTMKSMFNNTHAFNQDISQWNTSNVTSMTQMFLKSKAFNQDISQWNTSSVKFAGSMFTLAEAFDQNLGAWTLSSLEEASNIFSNSNMSCKNYSLTLKGWAENNLTSSNLTTPFNATNMEYSPEIEQERNYLINVLNWDITGDTLGNCSIEDPEEPIDSVAINELQAEKIYLYPNPVQSVLKISNEENSPIESIQIYNIMGEKVMEINNNWHQNGIDVHHLPTGVYFLEVTSKEQRKIIKQFSKL